MHPFRKNLLASLEAFQKQLVQNQEKLENLGRRDQQPVGVSANGGPTRRF